MENKLEIIHIETAMPTFSADFDTAKQQLESYLEKYNNVLVTVDTLKDDKKLAQELSAMSTSYNKERIAKVKEISEPIKKFETQMKELSDLCNNSANLIKVQVKKFEDERLKTLEVLLVKTITDMRNESEIDDEHRILGQEKQFIKLGSLTAKDALTKGAKDGIKAIVAQELTNQQRTQYRLLQLESESHKAGLHSPLVRLNVESFLFADDQEYATGLERIINSEVERQQQAEAKIKAQAEREAKIAAQAELEAKQQAEAKEQEKPVEQRLQERFSESEQLADIPPEYVEQAEMQRQYDELEQASVAAETRTDGKVDCIVTATFSVTVPNQVTDEMIKDKLSKMISSAGITSLQNMNVVRG